MGFPNPSKLTMALPTPVKPFNYSVKKKKKRENQTHYNPQWQGIVEQTHRIFKIQGKGHATKRPFILNTISTELEFTPRKPHTAAE